MKNYTKVEDLVFDYKKALEAHKNSFSEYTLNLLSQPINLIKKYRENPNVRLENKNGWFFLWKNNQVEIDGEWVSQEELIEKLEELLKK
jgi:hypothetical protein